MKMSQAEIDELIEMIDSNRDGEISRDEFVTFFKKLKLIKWLNKSLNPTYNFSDNIIILLFRIIVGV